MAGRPRKYDVKEAYKIYEKKYDKLTTQQKKRGKDPQYSKMKYSDFVEDWEENRLHYGPKYSGKQVAEALAKKDVYKHSFRQGKAVYKALKADPDFEKEVEKYSERGFALQYQKGLFDTQLIDFWDTVKTHRQELKAAGLNKDEIRLEIGQLYFGS